MPSKHGVSWRSEGHLSLLPANQVVRVYCYLTVVSLQYLTPLILTLNCTLLLKTLGERKLPCGVRVAWGSLRHPGLGPTSFSSSCPYIPLFHPSFLHPSLSLLSPHRWLLLGPGPGPPTIPSTGSSPRWPSGPPGG